MSDERVKVLALALVMVPIIGAFGTQGVKQIFRDVSILFKQMKSSTFGPRYATSGVAGDIADDLLRHSDNSDVFNLTYKLPCDFKSQTIQKIILIALFPLKRRTGFFYEIYFICLFFKKFLLLKLLTAMLNSVPHQCTDSAIIKSRIVAILNSTNIVLTKKAFWHVSLTHNIKKTSLSLGFRE